MGSGETGRKLGDMIKQAIRDCEITPAEYDAILAIANEDSVIDSQEKKLLSQLQEMLSNGTIKRVAG